MVRAVYDVPDAYSKPLYMLIENIERHCFSLFMLSEG